MLKTEWLTPWNSILDFPLAGRACKPRSQGLTMVIDKGLGLAATKDLLDMCAEHIDFIKLGFGTSALYPIDLLQAKIKLVRAYGVDIYPGGTFLEVALLQCKLDAYLENCYLLGFNYIEVSDGTIPIFPEQRAYIIHKARSAGFGVITEVGKKNPRDEVDTATLKEQLAADLENGAYKVIVEGRESGQDVVIYNQKGNIKEDDLEELLAGMNDVSRILWEAPIKSQQQELIRRFGPNVNLGNIQPADVMALEALRVGLRGDTLRYTLKGLDYDNTAEKG